MAVSDDHSQGGAPVHLSVAERIARGKAARAKVPRRSHAGFEPGPTRPDPIQQLERQAQTRVPELVPIRYGRMLVSPFTFFRGAAKIMASDLATTPRSGFDVQCCGDAHLSNFGVFASPDRRLVFDINDFDETHPGPWEWDVKRLAASMLIAARDNEYRVPEQEQVVLATVGTYRTAMREFAAMDNLAVWYARMEIETLLEQRAAELRPETVKQTARQLARARTRDSTHALSKLTHTVDGAARIIDQSPLIVPIDVLTPGAGRDELFGRLSRLLAAYRETLGVHRQVLLDQFQLSDFARKVVGVGSVGTQAWIALLVGRDGDDPLFLQVKQAEASVLEEFLAPSQFANHGERVVTGQRLMQSASDIFLGWLRNDETDPGNPVDFYGRQLKDWKGSAEIDQMAAPDMIGYGRLCGWTLARAHARTGDRVAIAAYLGAGANFDEALLEFADAYAVQNERDYAQLADAVLAGRIAARSDV
jgi:uncharacterized protein (DUF2252 family)